MADHRVSKVPVSGFGSSKLRKPWYLRMFPESLHPWLKGLFRKNPNEWSENEEKQFMQAMALAKKLEKVEDKMGLLSPGLDEGTDDPSMGETEGMLAYKKDYKGTTGPRWVDTDWSPEFKGLNEKDEGESALDIWARDEPERKRLEDEELYAGLIASEDYDKYIEDMMREQRAEDRFIADDMSLISLDDDDGSVASQKSKGLTPMQKYGAKLITDIFAEKEERRPQTIGASPITPGRSLDMSKYITSRRPKRDRYRNLGLLGRA